MMRFYSLCDVPVRPGDIVFRQRRWTKFAWTVAFTAMVAGIAVFAHAKSPFLYFMAAIACIFPLVAWTDFRRSLKPTNWLLRYGPHGLLIKYRSYLNTHFPEDDTVAFELPTADIAWVGKTVEWRRSSRSHGGQKVERCVYLDIKILRGDLADLKKCLAAERQALGRTGRYSTGRWLDYPVRVLDDEIIRVDFKGLGRGIGRAIEILSRTIPPRPEERLQSDFATPPKNQVELEARVRDLLQSGGKMAAIDLVRLTQGCSLTQAHDFVERVQNEPSLP